MCKPEKGMRICHYQVGALKTSVVIRGPTASHDWTGCSTFKIAPSGLKTACIHPLYCESWSTPCLLFDQFLTMSFIWSIPHHVFDLRVKSAPSLFHDTHKDHPFPGLHEETFYSHFISWSFVPDFYGSPAFLIFGGRKIVLYKLPASVTSGQDLQNSLIAQEYMTGCCSTDHYTGHAAMLENNLFVVAAETNVGALTYYCWCF